MQALEIGAHIGGALIAQIAILLERLVNDPLQFRAEDRDSVAPARSEFS